MSTSVRIRSWRALIAVAALSLVAAAATVRPAHSQQAQSQQPAPKGAVLLIMDSSGSMNGDDGRGRPKIDAAKDALRTLVDSLPPGAPVGLRVYGHRVPNTDKLNGCRDTELVFPVRPADPAAMKAAIGSYRATGFTPIGYSLQEGAKDLPPEGERTIILVSDGEDTCAPPDPCQVARDLSAQGIGLKIETVGFQVDPAARAQLQCIAQATGGSYRDAPDAGALAAELRTISTRALRQYQAAGRPVQGGAAHQDAPVLEPGRYVDTILPKETLWYAVEVAQGQDLVVNATLVGSPDVRSGPATQRLFEVQLVSPSLEEIALGQGRGYVFDEQPASKTVGVTARTGPVGFKESTFRAERPGRYYARINFDPRSSTVPQREYPLEIDVRLEGAAPAATSTTSSASGPARDAAQGEDDGGGLPPVVLLFLLGFLAALLVGAGVALGVLVGRSRGQGGHPPPPTPPL